VTESLQTPMAPLILPSLKPLFLKPSLSPWPPKNPNPSFIPISPRSSPLSLSLRSPPSPFPAHCSVNDDVVFERQAVKHPRPEEIPWSLDLANSVRLIGAVGKPVEIKKLPSGNVVAWTRLGVYKTSSETSW
jgi:hypothetical protein